MTIKKLLLISMTYMLFVLPLAAQLSLAVSDVNGEKGQIVEVGIAVGGFEEISSMQFSINWDSTILDFKTVENLTTILPDFAEKEIGLVETSSGAIRVAWFDNSISGISIPDGTQLFTIRFEIIGEAGTNSAITISDQPIVIEFTNLAGQIVELTEVRGGAITIPDNITSTTFLTALNGMKLYQNEPNPFKAVTQIKAILPNIADVQFFITDISGKIVYQNNFISVQGENNIVIERRLLDASGTYYYTLQSEDYQLSKRMILVP